MGHLQKVRKNNVPDMFLIDVQLVGEGRGGLLSENNKKKCVKNNKSFAVLTKRGGEVFPSPSTTAELEGRG